MDDKYINVQIPILDKVNEMEVVKTFTEEQLWYVCAIAKAFEKLEKENQILKDKVQDLQADYGTQAQIKRDMLRKENQELKKQLEYLRSEKYLNQLKFERDMLEDIVQNGEISKEDKDFLDIIHRNTELLSQQKEFIKYLEDEISELSVCWKDASCIAEEILSKYKEIIGSNSDVTR